VRLLRILLLLTPLAPASLGQQGPRLALGGEASFSHGARDDGYFNETAYDHNLLRLARLDLLLSLRLADGLSLLGDLRSENLGTVRPYALYLRWRPIRDTELDLQVGRIPPVFGAFPRRRYGQDNPLISWPLVWHHPTTLRPGAPPPGADALLALRGFGWYAGDPLYGHASGVPVASAARWDTGLQARFAEGPLAFAVALTQGTLSDPRVEDSNDGKQLSARLEWEPVAGLRLGASLAQGEFLDGRRPLPPGRFQQRAAGFDAEYARGRLLVRGEAIYSEWDVPRLGSPPVDRPLRALGYYLETRWRFAPGWHVAARFDDLDFGDIQGSAGTRPWEAPARRVEAGFGYRPQRHVLLKAVYQHNERDAGLRRSEGLVAAQALLWF
jgi:hypothetical protein